MGERRRNRDTKPLGGVRVQRLARLVMVSERDTGRFRAVAETGPTPIAMVRDILAEQRAASAREEELSAADTAQEHNQNPPEANQSPPIIPPQAPEA